MKYAYYMGCVVPSRLNQYDLTVRKILREFGIQLIDLKNTACCGTVITRSISAEANLIMSIRILAQAEGNGLDLLVICPGCYESLREAQEAFENNTIFSEKANMILKKLDNYVYNGRVKVKHFIQVLYENVGLDKLESKVNKPLNGLRVATHYGCHILRPSNKLKFDDPENPRILDRMIDITGAKSIYWTMKLWCCGSPIQSIDRKLSYSLTGMKLKSAKESEADCIVTICPSCQLQFDLMQNEVSKFTGEKYDIPILLYPQLLGLAIGFTPEEVALHLNRSSTEKFLEHLRELGGEGRG